MSDLRDFHKHLVEQIGASLGLSYEQLTADYDRSSYAAEAAARHRAHREMVRLQSLHIRAQFEPFFRNVMQMILAAAKTPRTDDMRQMLEDIERARGIQ